MTQYKLTCSCGKSHPVVPSDAGRTIDCSCGETVHIPSMLQIKKLPIWEESEELAAVSPGQQSASQDPLSPSIPQEAIPEQTQHHKTKPAKERFLKGNRLGILLLGLVCTLVSGFFLIRTVSNPPTPLTVLQKQKNFILNGSVVRRDSIPIDPKDARFYVDIISPNSIDFYQGLNTEFVTKENLEQVQKAFPDAKIGDYFYIKKVNLGEWVTINDWLIDHFPPQFAIDYFEILRNGPQMSDNFYENFDNLQRQHTIQVAAFAVLTFLSLIICIVPWLLPKQRYTVGTMRGSQW